MPYGVRCASRFRQHRVQRRARQCRVRCCRRRPSDPGREPLPAEAQDSFSKDSSFSSLFLNRPSGNKCFRPRGEHLHQGHTSDTTHRHTWKNSRYSLSYSQRDIAQKRNFSRLSDFDLAALLRIANKSWYDMRTVAYLPNSERECIREMMGVRNNWAHCSTELPGKDTILHDLKILLQFAQQVNCSKEVCSKIDSLINIVEQPDSISGASRNTTGGTTAQYSTVDLSRPDPPSCGLASADRAL